MHTLESKRVLVTGAGGFIGSHLVERLVQLGAMVRAFVRYNARNDPGLLALVDEKTRAGVEVTSGDLRDPHAVSQSVRGCDIVFHLGALIAIPYSYQHPYEVAETNVMGTMNMLLACRNQGIARLVHTSTSEVYGTARYAPIDEPHPLQGQSPYSASKIGADKLVESFHCSFSLPAVTVRPFNTFGPRQSARAVIPTIITQALANDTIRLGNQDATRDFTYVTDTVEGFIKAALSDNVEGMTINLGTGREVTIGHLAQLIVAKTGSGAKIELDSARLRPADSEVMRLLSDNTLARHRLGWAPQVTLEEGIDHTIAWVRANLARFRVGVYEV